MDLDKVIAGLENCQTLNDTCVDCVYDQVSEKCILCEAITAVKELKSLKEKLSHWISVDEALPTEIGQDCWVWADGWEYEDREPALDWWAGRRGENVYDHGTDSEFMRSGFYYNDMELITHWMPCDMPEAPKN